MTRWCSALVVTTPERARDLPGKSVPILATAQGIGPEIGIHASQQRWFPNMYYENVGRMIWDRAGVQPKDVLLSLSGLPVSSQVTIRNALREIGDDALTAEVIRAGKRLKLPAK